MSRQPTFPELRDLRDCARRYWQHLSVNYAPGTVANYWAAVVALHKDWLAGVSLAELGITFPDLKTFVKALQKKRPSGPRKENDWWTLDMFHQILQAVPQLSSWRSPAKLQDDFSDRVVFNGLVTGFTQLLRGTEYLEKSGTKSLADMHPWMLSDLQFVNTDGLEIHWSANGKPDHSQFHKLAYCKIRMVPSKADPLGLNEPLFFPAQQPGTIDALSPCTFFWQLCCLHPVPRSRHSITPLFPESMDDRSKRLQLSTFKKKWKQLCKQANLPHEALGTHALRRGGLVRLQDLNCSLAQMMALGRWKSDAVKIYQRRNKVKLMQWTSQMCTSSVASAVGPMLTPSTTADLGHKTNVDKSGWLRNPQSAMTDPPRVPRQILPPPPRPNARSKQPVTSRDPRPQSTSVQGPNNLTRPSKRPNKLQCPKCGKLLKSQAAMKYHAAHPSTCRKFTLREMSAKVTPSSGLRRLDLAAVQPSQKAASTRYARAAGANEYCSLTSNVTATPASSSRTPTWHSRSSSMAAANAKSGSPRYRFKMDPTNPGPTEHSQDLRAHSRGRARKRSPDTNIHTNTYRSRPAASFASEATAPLPPVAGVLPILTAPIEAPLVPPVEQQNADPRGGPAQRDAKSAKRRAAPATMTATKRRRSTAAGGSRKLTIENW